MLECNLSELLKSVYKLAPDWDRPIKGLSSDSQHTQAGDLFIAYLGQPTLWPDYIAAAMQRGAVAVLIEKSTDMPEFTSQVCNNLSIPIVAINKLASQVGKLAAQFYGHPSAHLQVIGVTGTNGKTSCSQFIAQSLEMSGTACGIIGTIGNGFPGHLQQGIFTTPDSISLQKLLAEFKSQNAQAVSMEVSSHGLAQNRVSGVEFDIGVFTNLTRDHLDYHGSMENYAQEKRKLFFQPGLQYAVINVDDDFGQQLLEELAPRLTVYGYSIQRQASAAVHASDIKLSSHGISAKITSPWGEGLLRSHLLGRFNLSNLLAAVTVLNILKIPFTDSLHYLAHMPTVRGRMQAFGGGKLPLVVVDYAHTPDALEKALTALREHCHGQLWCVFGCGGDRDKGKRELMGRIAEHHSDQLIITDDNPRHENPQTITDDIIKGLLCPWAVEIEHNRQAAIAHAIGCAQTNDVVLIAGKGHETYQQIGAEKFLFNDAEQVQQQLKLRYQL
jgi:UDP-N-acetylmuramoyl-L-alanyl-D-glutamate--2,6-diaminopimelate ligase